MITNTELVLVTALLAVSSALLAALLGYPVGNWLASLKRFKSSISSVLLLPFLLPAFLVGLTILPLQPTELTFGSAFGWILFGHLLMNIGFMARVVAGSAVPKEQLEASSLDGANKLRTRLLIEMPQQLPGIASASLLVALYSATSFGLVLTLGRGEVETLETQIAEFALRQLDLPAAGLLALLQTFLTIAFFFVARRLGANPTPLFGETEHSGSKLGQLIGLIYLAVVGVVITNVAIRAVTLNGGLFENLENLATRGSRDILNVTLLEAATNSLRNLLVSVLIALPIAWFAAAKRKPSLLVLLPIGISPVVVGLLFLVGAGYLPGALGNWWLVPLAQSVFLIPLGYQILQPARNSIEPEVLEASKLDGAGKVQTLALVEAPILIRPMAAAISFMALASLGEFGAASFLAYGSETTLALAMYRLAGRPGEENLGMAMTTSLLFIVFAFVVALLIHEKSGTRQERRVRP